MDDVRAYAQPLGRLLLSSLFIWAGIYEKLIHFGPGGTAQYFASQHIPVPDIAAWVVIIVEGIGGLLVLIGWQARWAALALAVFCLITGFAIHLPEWAKDTNSIHFFKNLALAGGFLYVFANGAGPLSVDGSKA